MASAKDLRIVPVTSATANAIVRRLHYSGKVVNNSQLHLGVFLNGKLEGALQFGPPMMKKNVLGLVKDTGWNGMLELNRMAFSEALPRNSESRALAIALRIIKKNYPHVEWVLSFADGTQCGDGTIYRASGFLLTQIGKNTTIAKMPDGTIVNKMTLGKGKHILERGGRACLPKEAVRLQGYQFRYIYFLNPQARARLTVPVIPYSKIDELGVGMYKGEKRAGSKENVAPADQAGGGGASPTPALQTPEKPA